MDEIIDYSIDIKDISAVDWVKLCSIVKEHSYSVYDEIYRTNLDYYPFRSSWYSCRLLIKIYEG